MIGSTKKLTERRLQRALDAMVEIIECQDTDWKTKRALDDACDAVRQTRSARQART